MWQRNVRGLGEQPSARQACDPFLPGANSSLHGARLELPVLPHTERQREPDLPFFLQPPEATSSSQGVGTGPVCIPRPADAGVGAAVVLCTAARGWSLAAKPTPVPDLGACGMSRLGGSDGGRPLPQT